MPPTTYQKSYGYGSYNISLNHLNLVLSSAAVFSAFFPKMCMLNHSCDPNTRLHVDGTKIYAYAIRDIGENEELFSTYGPSYKLSSTADRQLQMRTEFFFECNCNRCASKDTTYLKYYEYYCPNEDCLALVDMTHMDMRWWYYLDTEYCSGIDYKFKCDECGQRLPINPTVIKTFERTAQGHIDKGYTFYSTDDYVITSNLLRIYFSASKCLGKYHELKSRFAHTLLGYNVLSKYFEYSVSKLHWFHEIVIFEGTECQQFHFTFQNPMIVCSHV